MSHEMPPAGDKKPWWNDGDKIGGMAATVVVLCILMILFAVVARVAVWIFP